LEVYKEWFDDLAARLDLGRLGGGPVVVERRTREVTSSEVSGKRLTVQMTRDSLGVITSVSEGISELLGWRPEQLIGSPSTTFVHPADQSNAVAAWMDMITSPGSTRLWRGRYRTAAKSWKWVETENRFEDADVPIVFSSMSEVNPMEASLEEQFLARGQLLNQLSDALPVGVFEVDLLSHIVLTNKSFHLIVGVPPMETLADQMATVSSDDRPIMDAAIARAFACESVDDVEIRLRLPTGESPSGNARERVCLLGLRPLTDGAGVVSGVVGCLNDVTDRALLHQELERKATFDKLTSCFNRAATIELVDRTLYARHEGLGHAAIFIDLDGLKAVNDDLGHAAGDRLIVTAADQIRSALRDGDFVGRLGGDEFLVICPHVTSATKAMDIATRISRALTITVDIDSNAVEMRASIGVVWTKEALDTDSLIARADVAMYESKRLGNHGVTLFADRDIDGERRSHSA
jgi:diguanylate cyclase (GGDEF)-like protein/PAS domain S-box-containing protein